jgi:hypothetical protein
MTEKLTAEELRRIVDALAEVKRKLGDQAPGFCAYMIDDNGELVEIALDREDLN